MAWFVTPSGPGDERFRGHASMARLSLCSMKGASIAFMLGAKGSLWVDQSRGLDPPVGGLEPM